MCVHVCIGRLHVDHPPDRLSLGEDVRVALRLLDDPHVVEDPLSEILRLHFILFFLLVVAFLRHR